MREDALRPTRASASFLYSSSHCASDFSLMSLYSLLSVKYITRPHLPEIHCKSAHSIWHSWLPWSTLRSGRRKAEVHWTSCALLLHNATTITQDSQHFISNIFHGWCVCMLPAPEIIFFHFNIPFLCLCLYHTWI